MTPLPPSRFKNCALERGDLGRVKARHFIFIVQEKARFWIFFLSFFGIRLSKHSPAEIHCITKILSKSPAISLGQSKKISEAIANEVFDFCKIAYTLAPFGDSGSVLLSSLECLRIVQFVLWCLMFVFLVEQPLLVVGFMHITDSTTAAENRFVKWKIISNILCRKYVRAVSYLTLQTMFEFIWGLLLF